MRRESAALMSTLLGKLPSDFDETLADPLSSFFGAFSQLTFHFRFQLEPSPGSMPLLSFWHVVQLHITTA